MYDLYIYIYVYIYIYIYISYIWYDTYIYIYIYIILYICRYIIYYMYIIYIYIYHIILYRINHTLYFYIYIYICISNVFNLQNLHNWSVPSGGLAPDSLGAMFFRKRWKSRRSSATGPGGPGWGTVDITGAESGYPVINLHFSMGNGHL